MIRMLCVAVAVAIISNCGSGPLGSGYREPCPPASSVSAPPAISDIPDTLIVAGVAYVLDCTLWRDFMPISPPNGDPLRAVIYLTRLDSLAVADSLRLEHLWVTGAEGTWSTAFNDEDIGFVPPFKTGRIARCGPKWTPRTFADVIVSVLCGPHELEYIRARDVYIEETQ